MPPTLIGSQAPIYKPLGTTIVSAGIKKSSHLEKNNLESAPDLPAIVTI